MHFVFGMCRIMHANLIQLAILPNLDLQLK